jgi:hypothetical protein
LLHEIFVPVVYVIADEGRPNTPVKEGKECDTYPEALIELETQLTAPLEDVAYSWLSPDRLYGQIEKRFKLG